jgi:hypothetical protein
MPDKLLESARRQAEEAEPSIRAAALLRIARVEATLDHSRALGTLLEGLDAVRKLASPARDHLLQEARTVAAAVSPELLADIPAAPHSRAPGGFADGEIVRTMLAYGHVDAALNYALGDERSASFPFSVVGNVLHHLDPSQPESAARRLMLLRRAVDAWRRAHFDDPRRHERDQFLRVFAHSWSDFPPEEALDIARTIVARATSWPDLGTSTGYSNEIHFTSQRENAMFQVLHILRRLDPALAESLMNGHDQLAAAARRYPNGLDTINEEAKAEVERRKAEAATRGGGGGGGGFLMTGHGRDRGVQLRLIDAIRSGDFAPPLADGIEKYREDTDPATRNYAPKEHWPSTAAFRTLFYEAGKRLGPAADGLLGHVPDNDLRLFATIELAGAQAGAPAALSITSMTQPYPKGQLPPQRPSGPKPRIIAPMPLKDESATGPRMRSPDGRLIRCPECLVEPPADQQWMCKCDHVWNVFETAGHCPSCHINWGIVVCPRCGKQTQRQSWYIPEA